MNPAADPTPVEDVHGDGRWMSIHNRFVAAARELEPDVVFVGDSLLANLQTSELWEKWFAPMHSMNLAIGGDQTQNVLWRLINGELEFIQPKIVVVLVGTNNYDHTAEQVAGGIIEICNTLSSKQPEAEVVLLTLLPRGEKPNHLREKHDKINSIITEAAKTQERIQVMNLARDLIAADGTISHRDMFDYLHPTQAGYRRLFSPLHDLLTQMFSGDDSALVEEIAAAQSTLPSPSEGATGGLDGAQGP